MIQLACVDGGACLLIAAAVATGVSTLLVKWGLKKAPCDPHCPESKPKPPRKWKSAMYACGNCGGMELDDQDCCVGCGEP
jgi:hypothetical protein